jgi:glycine/D-amino acid oxidase-like deaminating enzyme
MPAVRHIPFWLDTFPKARRPSYPRFRGEQQTAVVIVGGGLTGCACAASFATAGVKTILLEADAIGRATSADAGVIREDFDASFQEAAASHGLRAARHLWQTMRRASLDFSAALRRLGARVDLVQQDLLHVAPRHGDAARWLKREHQARRDAGFDHSWLTSAAVARETALESGGAIKTRGAALDPYRAAVAFAAAAAARGAAVHERSTVRRIRATRKHVDVLTEGGTVRADAVLVATSSPIADLRALRRHIRAASSYAVVTEAMPAAVRRATGKRAAAIRDSHEPPHLLRWLKDDRVLFAGADQEEVPARAREKALVQRTGQLMYELSMLYPEISGLQPQWSWDHIRYGTVDRLPLIGLHRNFPRHLFAIGQGTHGAACAWLAARILLRLYHGDPAKGDEQFGFTRIL